MSKRSGGGGANKSNAFRVTLAMPVGAVMNCADNTGAKNLYIVAVYGESPNIATLHHPSHCRRAFRTHFCTHDRCSLSPQSVLHVVMRTRTSALICTLCVCLPAHYVLLTQSSLSLPTSSSTALLCSARVNHLLAHSATRLPTLCARHPWTPQPLAGRRPWRPLRRHGQEGKARAQEEGCAPSIAPLHPIPLPLSCRICVQDIRSARRLVRTSLLTRLRCRSR
jgi:hypothetical protein